MKRRNADRKKKNFAKVVIKNSVTHDQFKCRSCDKKQACYGSRYCQNEFNPVSLVTTPRDVK